MTMMGSRAYSAAAFVFAAVVFSAAGFFAAAAPAFAVFVGTVAAHCAMIRHPGERRDPWMLDDGGVRTSRVTLSMGPGVRRDDGEGATGNDGGAGADREVEMTGQGASQPDARSPGEYARSPGEKRASPANTPAIPAKTPVISAKAGIQTRAARDRVATSAFLDSRLRGNDDDGE
jgi:hypothetical protein